MNSVRDLKNNFYDLKPDSSDFEKNKYLQDLKNKFAEEDKAVPRSKIMQTVHNE